MNSTANGTRKSTLKNRLEEKFSIFLMEKYPDYDIKIVMSEEGSLPYMGLVMFYSKKEKKENKPKLVFTIILTQTSSGHITYVFVKDGKPDLDHKGMIRNFSLNDMVNLVNSNNSKTNLEKIINNFLKPETRLQTLYSNVISSNLPMVQPNSTQGPSNNGNGNGNLYSGGKKKRSTKKKTSTKKKSTKKTSKK